jgi:hypothetical protein
MTAMALRTQELGAVFRDTSASYKYYWLLAILDQLPALDRPLPVARIVEAMIHRAWATVAMFRLSLGKVDRLQDCVRAFQASAGLSPRISTARLVAELGAWPALSGWVDELARFVPGRFLGSWFPEVARQAPYDRRGSRAIMVIADQSWGTAASGPYRLIEQLGGLQIELAPGWQAWLAAHRALLLGFTEYHLTRYLQARNPNVPAISEKLGLPRRRSLSQARTWWAWIMATSASPVRDIFAAEVVGQTFEVDHFLPWSFVAHDEFWNLSPVPSGVNRDKADRIPDVDSHLPRLARLHAAIVGRSDLPPALARGYAAFLGVETAALSDLSIVDIIDHFERVIRPLAQIAANQGFAALLPRTAATAAITEEPIETGRGGDGLLRSAPCGAGSKK